MQQKKVWTFSNRRGLMDRAFIRARKDIRADGEILQVFLRDHDTTSVEYLKVTDWYQKWPSSSGFGNVDSSEAEKPQAWVDIRPHGGDHTKTLPQWLDADQTCSILEEVMSTVYIFLNASY